MISCLAPHDSLWWAFSYSFPPPWLLCSHILGWCKFSRPQQEACGMDFAEYREWCREWQQTNYSVTWRWCCTKNKMKEGWCKTAVCGILFDLSWQEDQGSIWAQNWDREGLSQLNSNSVVNRNSRCRCRVGANLAFSGIGDASVNLKKKKPEWQQEFID